MYDIMMSIFKNFVEVGDIGNDRFASKCHKCEPDNHLVGEGWNSCNK